MTGSVSVREGITNCFYIFCVLPNTKIYFPYEIVIFTSADETKFWTLLGLSGENFETRLKFFLPKSIVSVAFYRSFQDICTHKLILGYFFSTRKKGYKCSISQISTIFSPCSSIWFSKRQANRDDSAHWARAKASVRLWSSGRVDIGRAPSALKANGMSVSIEIADRLLSELQNVKMKQICVNYRMGYQLASRVTSERWVWKSPTIILGLSNLPLVLPVFPLCILFHYELSAHVWFLFLPHDLTLLSLWNFPPYVFLIFICFYSLMAGFKAYSISLLHFSRV